MNWGTNADVEAFENKKLSDAEIMSAFPEYKKLKDIPEPPPVEVMSTGIPGLDSHLRFPSIGLVSIVGPPSGGKSTVLRRISFNIAKQHRKIIALTCMEESVRYDTLDVFRRMWTGKEIRNMEPKEIDIADNFVQNQFRFVQRVGSDMFTGDNLVKMLIAAFEQEDAPDIFVLDPINEVDHRPGKEFGNKSDYFGDLIIQIKAVALHYRKLIIISAHPPAERMRFKGQSDEIWSLADVADSAHFFNKADVGLAVWYYNGDTHINIEKIKNRRRCGTLSHGYPYVVNMRFNVTDDAYRIKHQGWKEIQENR